MPKTKHPPVTPGFRSGSLTVTGRSGKICPGNRTWKCRCSLCGGETDLTTSELRRKNHCGCQGKKHGGGHPIADRSWMLQQKIFGKWKVIGWNPGSRKIRCICTGCGEEREPYIQGILSGNSTQCKKCGAARGKKLKGKKYGNL